MPAAVRRLIVLVPLLVLAGRWPVAVAAGAEEAAAAGVASRVPGGLVVQLGGDLQIARDLAAGGTRLVQVLLVDPQAVAAARQELQRAGRYGLVTVDQLAARTPAALDRLPYAENLLNALIVAQPAGKVSAGELARVLAPGGWLAAAPGVLPAGVARQAGLDSVSSPGPAGGWLLARKPWPAEMDQWPQPRHGADGNSVSRDTLVGPPRRVRWIAGPPQEVSNMVSAGGRMYYGGVIARDAFNGLQLWQRKLAPSPARGGFAFTPSAHAPRPIAVGAELLALEDDCLTAFDGASGAVRRKFPQAGTPHEVLYDAGLIVAVDKSSVRAVEYASGRLLWKYAADAPRYTVAGDGGVYFLQGDARRGQEIGLLRLDEKSGRPVWQQTGRDWLAKVRNCLYHAGRLVCEISTLDDEKQGNSIELLSAADGLPLWNHSFVPGSQHMKQARAMFVSDALWILTNQGCQTLEFEHGGVSKTCPAGGGHCFPPVATPKYLFHGEMHLTDLATGRVDANPITKGNCSRDVGFLPANGLIYTTPKHCICWPMLRDYTALAAARPGDAPLPPPDARQFICQNGPAQAPLRSEAPPRRRPPPQSPAPRETAQVKVAKPAPTADTAPHIKPDAARRPIPNPQSPIPPSPIPPSPTSLSKSPVLPKPKPKPALHEEPLPLGPPAVVDDWADQWPCYRHDAWRTASTTGRVPLHARLRWSTALDGWPAGPIADDWRTDSYVRGPVTAPVAAEGLVFVARPDAQEIVALDAASGGVCWRFTASGRIDTAPTIHGGLCLFGTRGGWVYALRADDGRLVWRLQAAPADQRIVAYGQVESPWPVSGSVLVVENVLYFAAGRQPLADGGILIFAVRPASGKVLWVQRLDQVPQTADPIARPFYNSTGLEFDNFDLLHCEGGAVAMSRWLFQRTSGKMGCDRFNGFVRVDTQYSGGGVWAPRGCWSYAPRNETEFRRERPFLRPLAVFRDSRLYSFAEDRRTLFRRDFDRTGLEQFPTKWFAGWDTYDKARKGGDLWRSQRLAHGARWTVTPFPAANQKEGTPGNALLLAGNALVVAGGEGGLTMLSPDDGRPLAHVDTPPIAWDSLATAAGRLFATTQDGAVICLME